MGRFFVGLEGRPDQAATALTEIFHLSDQLAAARAASAERTSRTDPSHDEGTTS
jgi:L-rhamnose mutarotase